METGDLWVVEVKQIIEEKIAVKIDKDEEKALKVLNRSKPLGKN